MSKFFKQCKDCRGKGTKRYLVPLYDSPYHDFDEEPEPTTHVHRTEPCRACRGVGYDNCIKKFFTEIKSETPKAYLFIIEGKEIWIAKSIIAKKEENFVVIPHWTKIMTQEQIAEEAKLHEFYKSIDESGYEEDMFF